MKCIVFLTTLFSVWTVIYSKKYILKIDELRNEFLQLETELWESVSEREYNSISLKEFTDVELIRYYKIFGDKLEESYPIDVNHGLTDLNNLWIWQRTYSELRIIYALYENFRRFQNKQLLVDGSLPSPQQAWIDLAKTVIGDSVHSIPKQLTQINEFVIRNRLVENVMKEANIELCNLKQSPQQIVYNLYNTIALTELKGYAMIQFSYMLLKLYNKGNYTEEANVMRLRYEERTTAMINKVKMVMGKLTKEELWVCDPKIHVQDETYVEITNLLQGYIENEVDLNGDGTCRENCPFYTYTKSHGCFKDMYCSQQKRCNGKIIGCQYVDSDMWICQAPESSSRRYEYIEYENGRILGQKTSCQKGATKVDSWWRWVFWHCSYCFCLCDDVGKNSDRYFNLRDVRSDIEHNRVVTGLRFTKQNKIIHLQVQEGELLPGANIDKNTVKWISPENYAITDRNVYNGQDYHTLTWEQRSLDLDDIKAPDGHVVTGVRFRKIGTHLNFEISVSPFNFSSGMLLNPKEKSVWMGNDNTDSSRNPRREIGLHAPDVPTRSRAPSTPGSYHNSYIKFTHSDINKDAAQTTVPFVDAQPVSSSIPLALGGAGIYHKGQLGYGGFVAPKIIMYDMSKHIKAEYPAAEIIN